MKVLVIHDEVTACDGSGKRLLDYLFKNGYVFMSRPFPNCASCLLLNREHAFDLVVFDVDCSLDHGKKLISGIKSILPIVGKSKIMVACDDVKILAKAEEAGVGTICSRKQVLSSVFIAYKAKEGLEYGLRVYDC